MKQFFSYSSIDVRAGKYSKADIHSNIYYCYRLPVRVLERAFISGNYFKKIFMLVNLVINTSLCGRCFKRASEFLSFG
jgi:hypothetical protein